MCVSNFSTTFIRNIFRPDEYLASCARYEIRVGVYVVSVVVRF
jgi:hypothetical protein